MLIRGRELLGRKVVLEPDQEPLGWVHDLVLDYERHTLLGLLLGPEWSSKAPVIPFAMIHRLARKTLSVWEAEPSPFLRQRMEALLARPRLLGSRLWLPEGVLLGVLAEVVLEVRTGQVQRYLVGGEEVAGGLFLSVSPQRLYGLLEGPFRQPLPAMGGATCTEALGWRSQ